MIKLNNYSIRKIDQYNFTYAIYKEAEAPRTKGRKPQNNCYWVESKKYFGSLSQCLESIKNEIISNVAEAKDHDQSTLLNDISRLQSAIDNLHIVINYEGKKADLKRLLEEKRKKEQC